MANKRRVVGPATATPGTVEELRAATREAHEAIRDLQASIRESEAKGRVLQALAREATEHLHDLLRSTRNDVINGMRKAIERNLNRDMVEVKKQIDELEENIIARFQNLYENLLGSGGVQAGVLPVTVSEILKALEASKAAECLSPEDRATIMRVVYAGVDMSGAGLYLPPTAPRPPKRR